VEPAKATLLLAPFALQYCYVVVLDWFGSGHSHPTVLQVGFERDLERTRRELYQQYENQLREINSARKHTGRRNLKTGKAEK